MRTDTVGQPIFFLDSPRKEDNPRDLFHAQAAEAYGPEAAVLLAERIENLMLLGASSSKSVVMACVKMGVLEVAIIGEDDMDCLTFPIPEELSSADAGAAMSAMINLLTVACGGVTDMLVNQILCCAHSDPLSALRNG